MVPLRKILEESGDWVEGCSAQELAMIQPFFRMGSVHVCIPKLWRGNYGGMTPSINRTEALG